MVVFGQLSGCLSGGERAREGGIIIILPSEVIVPISWPPMVWVEALSAFRQGKSIIVSLQLVWIVSEQKLRERGGEMSLTEWSGSRGGKDKEAEHGNHAGKEAHLGCDSHFERRRGQVFLDQM